MRQVILSGEQDGFTPGCLIMWHLLVMVGSCFVYKLKFFFEVFVM